MNGSGIVSGGFGAACTPEELFGRLGHEFYAQQRPGGITPPPTRLIAHGAFLWLDNPHEYQMDQGYVLSVEE